MLARHLTRLNAPVRYTTMPGANTPGGQAALSEYLRMAARGSYAPQFRHGALDTRLGPAQLEESPQMREMFHGLMGGDVGGLFAYLDELSNRGVEPHLSQAHLPPGNWYGASDPRRLHGALRLIYDQMNDPQHLPGILHGFTPGVMQHPDIRAVMRGQMQQLGPTPAMRGNPYSTGQPPAWAPTPLDRLSVLSGILHQHNHPLAGVYQDALDHARTGDPRGIRRVHDAAYDVFRDAQGHGDPAAVPGYSGHVYGNALHAREESEDLLHRLVVPHLIAAGHQRAAGGL